MISLIRLLGERVGDAARGHRSHFFEAAEADVEVTDHAIITVIEDEDGLNDVLAEQSILAIEDVVGLMNAEPWGPQ